MTAETGPTTSKGRETRERMIRAAGSLFRRQGYDGTGLNDVLERSGAPRGSLYFHFPGGKEELAVAAVDDSASGFRTAIEAILDSTDDVGEALARVVELQIHDLERTGYRRGCPIAAVTLDAAGGSEQVREACARGFEHWTHVIAAKLRGAGWTSGAADEQAMLIVGGYEGALMLSRARRDAAPLRALARSFRDLRPS
jgi:TetR/AcrR family transcriptional repressor of lmrAB and yxaGH operons